jgi:hypothetical protein
MPVNLVKFHRKRLKLIQVCKAKGLEGVLLVKRSFRNYENR